jgi:hypothetical protein|tara:strand:+ start:1171 stop:1482 length:312 start_codon:yes stop_codon:yes gene_type:complete
MPVKYDLIQHDGGYHEDHWSIRILEGDLEGVVFQYDTVSIREQGDEAVLDFEILYVEGEEQAAAVFDAEKIFGDILVGIIEENALRGKEANGNGNIDTEAPAE